MATFFFFGFTCLAASHLLDRKMIAGNKIFVKDLTI